MVISLAAMANTSLVTTFAMEGGATEVINSPRQFIYLVASLVALPINMAINTAAILVIQRNEKTVINNLVVCDCIANMLSMAIVSFLQSPFAILRSPLLCSVEIFVKFSITVWNRLVPVAIVVFRYLMVCCVFFVQQQGDRRVWRGVRVTLVLLTLGSGGLMAGCPKLFESENQVLRHNIFWETQIWHVKFSIDKLFFKSRIHR